MEDFEQKALASFHSPPKFWGRFVDDTLVIIDKNLIDEFTEHINNQHHAIKFTLDKESEGCLPMLDVSVSRDDVGNLSFKVYRKPTHTDQYLGFASNHPLQNKLGVIRTLCDRANSIVTKEEERTQELDKVRRSLAICGYEDWSWVTARKKREPKPQSKNQSSQPKGSVSIPYIPGLSESIQRLLRSNGIITHIKPTNTIRSVLVNTKDKTDKLDKCGVVYHIPCGDCTSSYIGESARSLRTRLVEHGKTPSSPVNEHVSGSAHSIDWEGVKILDREENWFRRGVKEAIQIKRNESDLNRDKGRHHLPPTYDSVIHSSDRRRSTSVATSGQMTQFPATNQNISRH
ncbi:uncharacterized protein [Amphiura filiformis]|uniref:uncharacterized protein n=1 Tax=Amphiura filiformis TaxID=82378 RepID=UPI003B20E44E